MIGSFLSAFALVLVFEGLMPFGFPERWKRLLNKIVAQNERSLRISGFISMLVGIFLLTIIHQFAE